MKNIPEELKTKVRKYSLMVAWWQIHEENEEMKDKVLDVLKKIEQTEDELGVSGVNTETFNGILKQARKFVTLPVGEMTDTQLETMCKLIFGQESEMVSLSKENTSKPGVIYFDPIQYAKHVRENKNGEDLKFVSYEHKKPLWMGNKVSIRSYIVEQAIEKGKGIRVKHKGETMPLTPAQLEREGFHNKENSHMAQHSAGGITAGERYYLIDYVFKPEIKDEQKQLV